MKFLQYKQIWVLITIEVHRNFEKKLRHWRRIEGLLHTCEDPWGQATTPLSSPRHSASQYDPSTREAEKGYPWRLLASQSNPMCNLQILTENQFQIIKWRVIKKCCPLVPIHMSAHTYVCSWTHANLNLNITDTDTRTHACISPWHLLRSPSG